MPEIPSEIQDLAIVGGGIMGLFTAFQASPFTQKVAVLERSQVGNPATASYGYTRTFRCDYLDPEYTRLAYEAQRLWTEVESITGRELLIRCGCLNIATASVTPDMDATYAERTHQILNDARIATESYDRSSLAERFPQVSADIGRLNVDGGIADLQSTLEAVTAHLAAAGIPIFNDTVVQNIRRVDDVFHITTDHGDLRSRSVVVTSGHDTNSVLEIIDGCDLRVSITPDKPAENKYIIPPDGEWQAYLPANFPVVAYLDVGIYCHPILEGRTPGIKVGYFRPSDVEHVDSRIDGVPAFVEECLPGLRNAETRDVTVVDQCEYDLTDDDDFILGAVPGIDNLYLGVGWRGTGYKFSPWVGRVLSQLALQGDTVYNISRFNPARL